MSIIIFEIRRGTCTDCNEYEIDSHGTRTSLKINPKYFVLMGSGNLCNFLTKLVDQLGDYI
jgi:hypothetical protein